MFVKNLTTTGRLEGRIILSSIFFLVVLNSILINPVYAEESSPTGKALISVANVSLNPEVFYPFDTGTLTCVIKNDGNSAIPVDRVTVYDNDIRLMSKEYDTTTWIAPGESRSLSFTLRAAGGEGTYYPILSVNTRDTGSIRYPVRLKVDSTKPVISIKNIPDTYTAEKKETIVLAISNPRDNEIKNLHLIPAGDHMTLSPTDTFFGTLGSGETKEISFAITPTVETDLTFILQYSNGENDHQTNRTIPIVFGYNKKQANPTISNVIISFEKEGYHITGDITNAGMENAVSVIITSTTPAEPIYPYKNYVIGGLKPDDFSSFELTFTANPSDVVPIEITYKDADGNVYTRFSDLDLTTVAQADEKSADNSILLVIVAGIGIGIIGLYFYRKRILPGVFR